jgi:signal transduction histidine kinase/CheY-like chemotaxis protein
MNVMRRLFRKYLSKEATFENRIFNGAMLLCTIGGVAAFISTAVQRAPISSILVTAAFPVVSFGLLAWANVTQRYRIAQLILVTLLCIISMPFIFFVSGGVNSGMLAYFLLGAVIICIMLRKRDFMIMIIIYIIVCTSCVFISYFFPDLVTPIETKFAFYIDVASALVISSVLISISVKYMMGEYADARKSADDEKDRAEEASQAKGSFLSNMSHEMRTPMNAIIGMTSIATATEDVEKKDYCLGKINDASTHLLGVINDILDISKIEDGKFTLSFVAFDFKEMMERVRMINAFRMEEKKQIFTVEVDENIPDVLEGDDQHLAQVITNLLSNAVKFTPDGGEISVRASLLKKDRGRGICHIQIDVQDSGIGISAEQQKSLFKSFQQADSGIARRFGGTGLGLAISKGIVEMMGGKIWIESAEDQGSTFSFIVQLAMVDADDVAIVSSDIQSEGLSRPNNSLHDAKKLDLSAFTILLAEDIDINREIIISLLEPTGLNIVTAENGVEALDSYLANPDLFDMIFMDIQMPEMSGYEAATRIRGLGTPKSDEIPIIAMTANVFKEDVDNYLAIGMNGHLGKPLDFEKVLEVLCEYLLD